MKSKQEEKSIILTDKQLKLFMDTSGQIAQLNQMIKLLRKEQDNYMTLIFEFAKIEKYEEPSLDISIKKLFYK